MRRFKYWGVVVLTFPFLVVGVLTGLVECLLGSEGSGGVLIASPFLWAYRRKV